MRKLLFVLPCLVIGASAFANIDVGEKVNQKYRWNGDNITSAIKQGYYGYLKSLKEAEQQCGQGTNCEPREERILALEDRDNLAKFLLEQERFSLNDALQGCVTKRLVTPNEVCGKVVSNLTDVLYNRGTRNIGYHIEKKDASECHLISSLSYSYGNYGPTDQRFVYTSKEAQDNKNGFLCEKKYGRACKHGDEVTFDQGAFFKGEKIEGKITFRCDLESFYEGWRLVR